MLQRAKDVGMKKVHDSDSDDILAQGVWSVLLQLLSQLYLSQSLSVSVL